MLFSYSPGALYPESLWIVVTNSFLFFSSYLYRWYKAKYFDTDSSAPLLHLIAFGLLFGYANDYHFHLSHEHGH